MISNLYDDDFSTRFEKCHATWYSVIAEKDLDSVDAYKRISAFASWCSEIGISRVTVYINMLRLGER